MFIYSSRSLRHVSAGNCGINWIVIQFYKMEEMK